MGNKKALHIVRSIKLLYKACAGIFPWPLFLSLEKYGDWLIWNMHIYYAPYEGLNGIMHFKAV